MKLRIFMYRGLLVSHRIIIPVFWVLLDLFHYYVPQQLPSADRTQFCKVVLFNEQCSVELDECGQCDGLDLKHLLKAHMWRPQSPACGAVGWLEGDKYLYNSYSVRPCCPFGKQVCSNATFSTMMLSLPDPKAMEPFDHVPKTQKYVVWRWRDGPMVKTMRPNKLCLFIFIYQMVCHSDEKMTVLVNFDCQWMDQ